ncbi:putative GTPase-activating protein [Podospora australis]|uniref:GTPase-activating protein n=1 Tax=Podospora australis TaxID=1536484 RepID=A0AAN7AJY3_9PEZI|nr:putative GTPase-activating protein [Podospora australis]
MLGNSTTEDHHFGRGSGSGSGSGGAGSPAGARSDNMYHSQPASQSSLAKPQRPNAGPWSKHNDDAHASEPFQTDYYQHQQARNFRVQNLQNFQNFSSRSSPSRSNHQRRPSSSPKPTTLDLTKEDRRQVHPDLLSPRSDSFFFNHHPTTVRSPSTTPTASEFHTSYRTRAESNPTPRAPPRSLFPGLSSNPFIPEQLEVPVETSPAEPELEPVPESEPEVEYEPQPSPRKFPLLAQHQYDHLASMSPVSMISRQIDSPTESRRGTPTPSESTIMTAENVNFSRPRKTSVRSQQSDSALSRRMAPSRTQVEPTMEESTAIGQPQIQLNSSAAPNPWPRHRRLSASSSHSSSTFSSIPHRQSQDQLNSSSRSNSQQRYANAPLASISGPFARSVLGPSSSGTQAYAREAQAQAQAREAQGQPREPPPWLLAAEETRSSFRSQLTSSTAQGTVFTMRGTERNSVMTKASSVTEQSIINGYYARASWWHNSIVTDDGLLDDVMGMYERGFNDSDVESMIRRSMRFPNREEQAEEEEEEEEEEEHEDVPPFDMDENRPETSYSNADAVREKILEAMNDSLPMPTPVAIPTSDTNDHRQSVPRFRKSLLPNSLPKDFGFGMAEHMAKRRNAETGSVGKHDSAKMLDNDGDVSPTTQEHTKSPPLPSPLKLQEQPVKAPSPPPATPTYVPQLPREPPEDPSSRDRYGFRKASPNVTRQAYDAWNANYTEYLARRRKKWVAFLKDNSLMTDRPNRFPLRSAKTKRFIRKGIPPDWRGAAWFYYAGGPAILSKHRGVYDDLLRRAGLDPNGPGMLPGVRGEVKPLIVDDIEKDLYRTFPDNIRFKPVRPPSMAPSEGGDPSASALEPGPEPEIITSLRRVLHAFALYNPRIGYCQSLNFLAGLLLLFVETEEQAFWLLNVITRVYLPGTHEMSLEGSKVDLGVLMVALKDSLPGVWKQIGGDEAEPSSGKKSRGRLGIHGHKAGQGSVSDPNRLPAITLCMTAWFMSCFIGTLPIESVLRVWDVFFYEGSRTLFRVALTIFKLGEPEIKAVQDPMEMFGVVQQFPRKLLDCNALMELCYKRRNGIGHLSQDAVEEKRQERREGIRKWKAEQEAAAIIDTGAMNKNGKNNNRLVQTAGLDLATSSGHHMDDASRKGNLFSRRKDREQVRAAEVM